MELILACACRYDDVRGIVAMHNDYCTVEPFIEWEVDLRIQKIGPFYRCMERRRCVMFALTCSHSLVRFQ